MWHPIPLKFVVSSGDLIIDIYPAEILLLKLRDMFVLQNSYSRTVEFFCRM